MKSIVSVIKDDFRNHTIVTYEDGSREILSGVVQNQEANKEIVSVIKDEDELREIPSGVVQNQETNKEIVSVIKDDQREEILVVFNDGSKEYIFV